MFVSGEEEFVEYSGIDQGQDCYKAKMKMSCPRCGEAEAGARRMIPHKYDCTNKNKKYCTTSGGGKKSRRKNKRSKRRKSIKKRHLRR